MPFDIRNWDSHTVTAPEATGSQRGAVNHLASAEANVRAMGQAVKDAFDPANHFRATAAALSGIPYPLIGLGLVGQVLMFPWNLAFEVADVPLAPMRIAVNGAHAVYHGVAVGVQKLRR